MASEEKLIQRMLQAAQGSSGPQEMGPQATDYDWSVPHRFGGSAMRTLDDLAAETARRVSRLVQAHLRFEQPLESAGFAEIYAGALIASARSDDGASVYASLKDTEGRRQGLVRLPSMQASAWVSRLLGGAAEGEARELSALELSLLGDILDAVGGEVREALESRTGAALSGGGEVRTDLDDLAWDESLEILELGLRFEGTEEPAVLQVYIPADVAAAAEDAADAPARTPEQNRQALLKHLQRVDVRVHVDVGKARAPMREVAAVDVGDVLVLDIGSDDPVDLRIDETLIARGFPVVCEGRYAIQVADVAVAHGARPAKR